MKMFFCCLRLPPSTFHKTTDELFFSTDEIDHPTLIVTNDCNAANISHGEGIRDFELAVTQVCAARTDYEREIVGNVKMLPIVHTHTDEQLSV